MGKRIANHIDSFSQEIVLTSIMKQSRNMQQMAYYGIATYLTKNTLTDMRRIITMPHYLSILPPSIINSVPVTHALASLSK